MTAKAKPSEACHQIARMAIIDDAEFDQMLYARIIQRTGLVGELLSFYSAEEALTYFQSPTAAPVDVILLDINMPGMSGFDFLDEVTNKKLKDYADVVIVMLTTSLDPRDLARAAKYELVKDYINKPLEEEHVSRISHLVAAIKDGTPTLT